MLVQLLLGVVLMVQLLLVVPYLLLRHVARLMLV
jgi:hypothetical protein